MTDFLTTRELASLLRVKERKVYDLVAAGALPVRRVTGKLLFPRNEIDAWLGAQSSHGGANGSVDGASGSIAASSRNWLTMVAPALPARGVVGTKGAFMSWLSNLGSS